MQIKNLTPRILNNIQKKAVDLDEVLPQIIYTKEGDKKWQDIDAMLDGDITDYANAILFFNDFVENLTKKKTV